MSGLPRPSVPRTRLMVTHLARMDAAAREALRTQAQALLQDLDAV